MKSAFVAGATGYTGREVSRQLAATGVRAWAHVRPDSRQLDEWKTRFGAMGAQVDTTPWDEAAMTDTLKRLQPDVVFALLGTTRHRMSKDPVSTYEAVDYGLTALLMRACVKAGHKPRFVYLSSAGLRPNPRNPYFAVRWRLEQELKSSGLPYTIARPSFITGPDREESRTGERVGAKAIDIALGAAALIGMRKLAARYRSTTGPVLAAALVRLAGDRSAAGRIVESEDLH